MRNKVAACFIVFFLLVLAGVNNPSGHNVIVAQPDNSGAAYLTLLKGEAIDENRARLFFMALDEAGKPLKYLAKEDFTLNVEGKEITDFTIEHVSAAQSPLSIVLGIDISGSMKGTPFAATRRSISRFLDQSPGGDYMALLVFGSGESFVSDFTAKRYEIREKMEALTAVDEWTHLYDGIFEALKKAHTSAPTTRKALIFISDGKDEGSTRTRSETLEKAATWGIPVFAIGFGQRIDKEYLAELAQVSGGYFLQTPDPDEITTLYDKVLDILKNEYAITFDFTRDPGRYMAHLVLAPGQSPKEGGYQGEGDTPRKSAGTAETYKEFLFKPTGMALPETAGQADFFRENSRESRSQRDRRSPGETVNRPQELPMGVLVLLILAVIIIAVALIWLKAQLTKKNQQRVDGSLTRSQAQVCELFFLDDTDATQLNVIQALVQPRPGKEGGSLDDSTKFTGLPEVYLEVESYPGRMIPLSYQGTGNVEELIIARRPASGEHDEFLKKGSVYLMVPADWQVISRARGERPGHARIFHSGENRYSIEDLGSKVGTLVNNRQIKGKGAVVLEAGDSIDIGGKSGIRIVYKEVVPGQETAPPPTNHDQPNQPGQTGQPGKAGQAGEAGKPDKLNKPGESLSVEEEPTAPYRM